MHLEVIKYTNNYDNTKVFIHGAGHSTWYWDVHFLPYFYQRGYNVYAVSVYTFGHNLMLDPDWKKAAVEIDSFLTEFFRTDMRCLKEE